jgi:hypothetical protein
MKFPIIIEDRQPLPQFDPPIQDVPQFRNRDAGEGGFWARIVYQDANLPWRYAFVESFRIFDATAAYSSGDINFFGYVFGWLGGVNQTTNIYGLASQYIPPQGEMSVWQTEEGYGPGGQWSDILAASGYYTSQGVPGGTQVYPGSVVNWADEVNHNQSVPIGSVVWLRSAEVYTEPAYSTINGNYAFEWSYPILGRIGFGHKVSSSDLANDNQYQWQEVRRQRLSTSNQGVVTQFAPNCRQSDPLLAYPWVGPLLWPAREINGNIAVPLDATVWLWPGQVIEYAPDGCVVNQEYLFEYQPSPEWGSWVLTGTSTGTTLASGTNITVTSAEWATTLNLAPGQAVEQAVASTAPGCIQINRVGNYQLSWNVAIVANSPITPITNGTWGAAINGGGGSTKSYWTGGVTQWYDSMTIITQFFVEQAALPYTLSFSVTFDAPPAGTTVAFQESGSTINILRLDDNIQPPQIFGPP